MLIVADLMLHKVFKINSQENYIGDHNNVSVSLTIFGLLEHHNNEKELKKATDLLADGRDLQSAIKNSDWVLSVWG